MKSKFANLRLKNSGTVTHQNAEVWFLQANALQPPGPHTPAGIIIRIIRPLRFCILWRIKQSLQIKRFFKHCILLAQPLMPVALFDDELPGALMHNFWQFLNSILVPSFLFSQTCRKKLWDSWDSRLVRTRNSRDFYSRRFTPKTSKAPERFEVTNRNQPLWASKGPLLWQKAPGNTFRGCKFQPRERSKFAEFPYNFCTPFRRSPHRSTQAGHLASEVHRLQSEGTVPNFGTIFNCTNR